MKSYSKMKVYPVNWETSKKSISKDWIVRYVFTDPEGQEHATSFKGMNHLKDHAERVGETKRLIEEEVYILERGYNPKTKQYMDQDNAPAVNGNTPFISALAAAIANNEGVKSHIADMENTLKHVKKYAAALRIYSNPIKEITKGDIKQILLRMKLDGKSNYRINKTKSHISGCFKFFVDLDIFDVNFVKGISNVKHTPSKKNIIRTDEDWKKFHKIRDINMNVYNFLCIFFYSGCRFEEMTQIKKSDVELDKSIFWINLKKQGQYCRAMRPININAWELWKDLCENAGPEQYLFSHNQRPNDVPVLANSMYDITAKYLRMVGLDVTGYGIKHSYINMVTGKYGISKASELAGHTNIKTTKTYAVDFEEQQVEYNKNIDIQMKSS